MFYKVVVTVWDIKATEGRGRGPYFSSLTRLTQGAGEEERGGSHEAQSP